jgi:CRP/FNR family cyclic AMP-dependent transcriptional regulator
MASSASRSGARSADTLMGALPESDAQALGRLGSVRRFRPGEALMTEGGEGTEVFIILEGLARVVSNTQDGRLVMLAIRVAGDIIGELAVLDEGPRSATVQAAGPLIARAIPASRFLAYLQERPQAAFALQRVVSRKLRTATRRRIDLTGGRLVAKLARVLAHLALEHPVAEPTGVRIGVRITHDDLCGLTGASNAALERAVQQLREAALIATGPGRGRILVLDPDGLRQVGATGEPPPS